MRSLPSFTSAIVIESPAQFLAWSGWFSFLFFASLFVAQHYLHRHPSTPNDSDLPARAGSFALLLYAIVALIAGTLLPLLQTLGASAWAMKRGEPMRRMLALPTPRNIWATSQLLFAILMIISLLVKTTAQATALIALAGVSWAVTCWVPFAVR